MRGKLRGFFDNKRKRKPSYTPQPGPPVESTAKPMTTTSQETIAARGDLQLADAAMYGLLGSFIRKVAEHTGASRAGMLVTALSFAGSYCARQVYFRCGTVRQYPRLSVMTAAQAMRVQHSAIISPVHGLFATVNKILPVEDTVATVCGPVVSRRDPISSTSTNPARPIIVVGGFDGAWWRRSGCGPHAKLCSSWDGFDLPTLADRRREPSPPIALVGHVHLDDLVEIAPTALDLAARCLWCWVDDDQCDDPTAAQPWADDHLQSLADKLASAITYARETYEMTFDTAAQKLWLTRRPVPAADRHDFVGGLLQHGGAQVIRIAMVLALLDSSREIGERHLEAALAIWDYCRRSAERVFGVQSADPFSQRLQDLLATPRTKTELHAAFRNHTPASRLDVALANLEAEGIAVRKRTPTAGRPRETWMLRGANQTD